jgi:hypothetical protein
MIIQEERECSRHQVDCKFTFEDLGILVAALGDYQDFIEDTPSSTDDEANLREITQVRALMLRVKKYSEPSH